MNTIEGWDVAEWEVMKKRLEQLSPDQLRALAARLGIQFTGGNADASKEDLILVMDEATKPEIEKALSHHLP